MIGLWVTRPHRRVSDPLQVAIWDWETPYQISVSEADSLGKLGIREVFVRAGTFSSDGQNIVLVIPQKYSEGSNRLPVHLVFNADGGVIRHFEDYDLNRISNQISTRLFNQVQVAERNGVHVVGIQLDFDIATRLLSKYAQLVQRIRQSNPLFARNSKLTISITGLMSWLGTSGVAKLSNEVDFMVPQAYEGYTSKTSSDMRPIFDGDDLKRRLRLAEDLNCPYWIGIPSYGHALLFNDHDELVATYRGLDPHEALRHPSFKLIEAYPTNSSGKPAANLSEWSGEEIIKLKAIRPAANGEGLGYTLAYNVPTPELTERARSIVEENRGGNCRGVIIYRMPRAESSLTVPLESLLAKQNKQPCEPKLDVKIHATRDRFEAIESHQSQAPNDVYLEVVNSGNGSSFVSPDAVDISLKFDQIGFGDVRLRAFDRASFSRATGPKSEAETTPDRANTIHLFKAFTYPGQKLLCGPIRLLNSGKVRVTIRVRIRHQSGFSYLETTLPEAPIRSGTGGLP